MANAKFARYAWIVLAYTVPVILFGAFVRAGLHGDGCGAYWPGCNGALIPEGTDLSETIEFIHRASSAVLAGRFQRVTPPERPQRTSFCSL